MTMEIYSNIQSEPFINNIEGTISKDNRAETNKGNKVHDNISDNEDNKNMRGCMQCNPLLKDLIKILILNQIGNNNKPPRPPKPPMFHYPQGPQMPGMGYPPGPPRAF